MADDTPTTPRAPIIKIGSSSPQMFIAGFLLSAFVGAIALLCWHVVPTENKDGLEILIGVLAASLKDCTNYFYGSTSSSKDKDATINSLASATPTPTTGAPA